MTSHPSPLITLLLVASAMLFTSCVTEFQPAPGVTVPTNLEEAYLELDNMLDEQQKAALREGDIEVEELVLTFGMQLKEYWGLWQDSKIAKYLRKRDVEHPDQMITVIFDGYVGYLRKQ